MIAWSCAGKNQSIFSSQRVPSVLNKIYSFGVTYAAFQGCYIEVLIISARQCQEHLKHYVIKYTIEIFKLLLR